MDLGLGDKVALVTGAGSQIGYGRAISLMLAQEGCDIVSADIDLAGAEKTAAEVNALGRKAIAVKVDVRNGAEVEQMVDAAIGAFGKIDILVNNAGSSSKLQPFVKMTPEDWQYDIEVNLFGQMNVAHAVLPHMIARKYGRIVNTSGGRVLPTFRPMARPRRVSSYGPRPSPGRLHRRELS
jgi:NAD(P)-dependent dehydrogenase (short-subunit alcohol dehydrogenase family)